MDFLTAVYLTYQTNAEEVLNEEIFISSKKLEWFVVEEKRYDSCICRIFTKLCLFYVIIQLLCFMFSGVVRLGQMKLRQKNKKKLHNIFADHLKNWNWIGQTYQQIFSNLPSKYLIIHFDINCPGICFV